MKGKKILAVISILAVALIVRYLSLPSLLPGTFFHIDEVRYYKTAQQLLQTGVLGFNSATPNSFITPGYIFFLVTILKIATVLLGAKANFGLAIIWAQIILSLGVITLVFLISERVANFRVAVTAAVLSSFYPPLIFANSKIMTEMLFTFFFLLYVYLVQIYIAQPVWYAHGSTGIILAITALIRPTVVPVILLPYLIQAINRKQPVYWQGLLITLVTFSLVLTPWWIRNYQIYQQFIPFSTESGDPFLRGTDPYDPHHNHGEILITGVPEKDKFSLGLQRIKNGFRDKPIFWLQWFTIGKTSFLWSKPWGYVPAWGEFSIAKIIHWLLIIFLGGFGLIKSLRKPELRWLASLPVFFTGLQLFFLAIPRYVFQLTPIMLIFAAIMLIDSFSFIKKQFSLNIKKT